jgi:aromatic ring hydroxylase
VRLFRLAWDLTSTQFGSRQALYARFFSSDVVRLRQGCFKSYDYGKTVGMVDRFLQRVDAQAVGQTQAAAGRGIDLHRRAGNGSGRE